MTCKEVYIHVCDNLDGNLDSPECHEIRAHLETCPGCQGLLHSLKKTVALYRAAPTPGVSASAHERLLELIDGEWSGRKEPQQQPRK